MLQQRPPVIQLTAHARHFSSLMAEALQPAADNSDTTLQPPLQRPHLDAASTLGAQQLQPLQQAVAAAGSVAGPAAPAAAPRRPLKRPRSGSRKQATVVAPVRDDRPKRVWHVGSCIHCLVPSAPLAYWQADDHTKQYIKCICHTSLAGAGLMRQVPARESSRRSA